MEELKTTISLEIYNLEHHIYGDSHETIFKQSKEKVYSNYEDIKLDIITLANSAKKLCKQNQEFNIFVNIDKFCIADYYSYVAPINSHLKKGYTQQYKDWKTVLDIFEKYIKPKNINNINTIKFNSNIFLSDFGYKINCLINLLAKNPGKELKLKNSVSNDWNGEIEGFYESNGKYFIDCYWQGYSTDGNESIKFGKELDLNNGIKFTAKELKSNGLTREFYVSFERKMIEKAIINLFKELDLI